ncbi:alcohol dehydrogenase catalytic domain-containing protein [Paraburkholderia strydomiana]|uniref:alcohol dehydrogenase catalytic domain-containing protein n=1 Tax=Paraburkholderia strydomiana TaxID=1245417 RepID=UPI001BED12AD|nr:alcohol dehydrogenase catalytic domain-containing protein [Paraburkholderia strydomiana]MBT2792808.1 zinc-binding dehydrogenase [Paraburkholderia strydomiana]
MLTIIHRRHGAPEDVLELAEVAEPGPPGPDEVLIRVTRASIHPGDLHGVEGSPAFGSPPHIAEAGRTPGFDGVGVIEAIGSNVDPAMDLSTHRRVAYFPIANGWSERVVAPASAVMVLPENLSNEVAAQALINTVTAEIIIRAGHNAWAEDRRGAVTVIQSGAASAVGRIITTLLAERGASVIRLVRSRSSARALEQDAYEGRVISTEDAGCPRALREAAAGQEIHVALDGVGGAVLPGLAEVLSPGSTIISYGSLGGASTDIRLLVPRGLTIRGVSINQWFHLPAEVRQTDIQTALRLADARPELFPVESMYPPDQIKQAVRHVSRPGRTGAVLLAFQGVAP